MEHDPDLSELGAFVRERRQTLGLTQRALGERIDWGQERVSLLERGGYGLPSLIILARLATALQSPLSALLGALGYQEMSPAAVRQSAHCAVLLITLENFLALRSMTFRSVLVDACNVAARVMGADIVELYLYDEASRQLVSSGCSTMPLGARERELGLDELPLGSNDRVADVFVTGTMYATGESHTDPRGTVYADAGIESVLAAPIILSVSPIGVLVAGSRDIDRFSEEERHFFLAVAHWLGLIADRERAVEQDNAPRPAAPSNSH